MSYQTLALDLDALDKNEGILTITLSRPDQLNAFTVEMADELVDAFNNASDNDAVAAIIVTGSGRAFCSGMDLTSTGNVFGLDESQHPTLTDMDERLDDPEIIGGVRDTGGRVTLAIYNCKKPVIAAINGAAVGIGATMILAMDVRIASEHARIGFVFGRIGITPEACSTWFLPRIVGISQALEWMYSADILTAAEAERGGLVRNVVPGDKLLEEAKTLARKFVSGRSAVAVAMTRQMMYRNSAQPHPLAAHKIDSLSMFYSSIGDGKEGVDAFLGKRGPAFTSKASEMPPFYEEWIRDPY